MALPEIWYGSQAWMSFQEKAAAAKTPKNMTYKIKSIELGGGTRESEDIYVLGNYTISKDKRAEMIEVSITGLSTDTVWRYIWAGGTEDTTEPILVSGLGTTKLNWRIVLFLKDASTQALFESSTTTGYDYGRAGVLGPCLRYTFTDAKTIQVTESLEADGELSVDVSFKCAAINIAVESSSTSATSISTLATYTG